MIDKGFTKAAYQKIAKLMPNEFRINDLPVGSNSGMIARGIRYGVIEKVGPGRYRVVKGIDNPWEVYQEKAAGVRTATAAHARAVHHGQPAVNKDLSERRRMDQVVRVTPYTEDEVLIQIGRRLYVAHEVVLASRRNPNG